MGVKRRRTSAVVSTRRPIDKTIFTLNNTFTTSNVTDSVVTATFPCTITGIRWDLWIVGEFAAATAESQRILGCLCLVKEGTTISGPDFTDSNDTWTPEGNVLVQYAGVVRAQDSSNGADPIHITGETKTMRKLQAGDLFRHIINGQVASATTRIFGTIQVFCKA